MTVIPASPGHGGPNQSPIDRLDGKVALVTGAGSAEGIGYATARRLIALGARVAVVSTTRRIHDRAAELGGTGLSLISPTKRRSPHSRRHRRTGGRGRGAGEQRRVGE